MTVSGLLVPGTQVGGAARLMSPGAYWSPVLPIRQKAATCWYHANTPFKMAPHVYNGLVGMWIVEDEESKSLPLPKHYGVMIFRSLFKINVSIILVRHNMTKKPLVMVFMAIHC